MATSNLQQGSIYSEDFGGKKGSKPRKLAKRHQSLLDPAAFGVARFKANGLCFMANRALCQMLGYDRSELRTKTIEEITHPDDWSRQKKLQEKIVNGEQESYSIDKRCICRSSLPLPVNETTLAVRDDSGSYLYSTSLFEVNERKRREQLFHLTLESSSDAMAIVDESGEIVLVNSSAERVFGYRHSELLGKTIESLLPDFWYTGTGLSLGKFQIELMRGKWDSQGRRKDGTFFPAEIGVRALETGQGTWTINSIADLSEQQPEKRPFDIEIAS
jgi:PAS domain S-box-containing protein